MRVNPRDLLRGLCKGCQLLALLCAVLLQAGSAGAAAESEVKDSGSPGDIIVSAVHPDESAVKGFRVLLILPGPDGSLDKGPNILFESTDGDKFDADGEKNGAVVFSIDDIGGYAADGIDILIEASLNGYIPHKGLKKTYNKDEINSFTIEMKKQKSNE
jgi:hypothetical protein